MIGGGTHSMIHPFGVTGFNRLTALCEDAKLKSAVGTDDPRQASRPFDKDRGGFVLGEGAGIVVLETLDHAVARGATILAEVAGYGSTADAYRITDQAPDGSGAIGAMKAALADANMTPADIGLPERPRHRDEGERRERDDGHPPGVRPQGDGLPGQQH